MFWIIVALFQVNIFQVQAQNEFNEKLENLRKECFRNQNNRLIAEKDSEQITCHVDFYGMCWPKTLANLTVSLPCPSIFFDKTSGNISRRCNESGGWGKPDISFCNKHSFSRKSSNEEEDIQKRVYVVFCWFSLSVMIPSLIITVFLFKGKSERFNVHTNLILAFTFRITTFFIHHYGNLDSSESSRVSCNFVWILNRYFASTEIMWMLNEALLLLRKVVIIFDKKSYFKYYLVIGWGSPLVFLAAYIPIMVLVVDTPKCWMHYKESMYMLVLYVPMVLVLFLDFIALIYTVSIFVRRQKGPQKNDFVKIRKTIKGTLILSPLLGVIYLLIFFVPDNAPVWWQYVIRIAYTMQGTLACLVYITFSGELINKAKSRYRTSLRGTRILENGYSWSFSARSRNTEKSSKGKKTSASPSPSIDPSGLSHSSPSCDNGPKCGCPDSLMMRESEPFGHHEEENSF